MASQGLGSTLIIANPSAHSGRGETAAILATRIFSSSSSSASSCSVRFTEGPTDAEHMAASAGGYDTVVALGGDGVIHEVVNGLMTLSQDVRPKLGIIPMGSGNDFARTICMKKNDPDRAIETLLRAETRTIDLGRVNECYFVQTLSFGLDAAIALDTMSRRERKRIKSGPTLYMTSGIRLLLTGVKDWPFRAKVDGVDMEGIDIAFAIQNGPTYGGGFRICPKAVPNDGYLDLCVNVDKPSLPHSMLLFGLTRFGQHTRSKKLSLSKVRHVEVEFLGDEQPPCQVDGEKLVAKRYVVDVMPQVLDVIVPAKCKW